ncbi:MAG: transglycosylase SLT domain-containing protein [Candidatus Omnitrophica bacterium]|nr:transglycosylase SLT domain-containing protein [Candidatus Omnitrophota bacterium]
MVKKKTNVDVWFERETQHKREALENASRYFDENDNLTVNTLEAIYGKESSFGTQQKKRGIDDAAGHFQFEKPTAKEYNLTASKNNDQRFDIDYASSAAARYLKDLNSIFSKKTSLSKNLKSTPVKSKSKRKKFVLAAYNAGQGRIARAQSLAEQAGKNPQKWNDVKKFLEAAGATKKKTKEICEYVDLILRYEAEFAEKSIADKRVKNKKGKKPVKRCASGHWVTIDDRPVFICD